MPSPRQVNYDAIAHLYDTQPYRDKQSDPALRDLRQSSPPKAILDMCCGTGNQLIANRPHLPGALMVGLDFSHGMLRQARPKSQTINWVQADSTTPPFADNSFDYISHQFAFHHIPDKPRAAQAMFRLLRPGGCLVMTNLHPHTMQDWLYYRYFPAALTRDLHDFLPHDVLTALMRQTGFHPVSIDLNPIAYEEDLHHFHQTANQRDTCSQLLTLSDADYQSGLHHLTQDLQHAPSPYPVPTQITLLTLTAHKP
ncbi:class I SAM-dependent methyltransferase [Candidatus Entotheonella palauensis]|uniref:class I SAM-dependent methyltransferase n=1 Tax=Candidatus Entotheonella palauensis TaxID=93172 RepID=UPI000B7F16C8|nr:class I SAM-dependent methyltransferase [Candidatus Entotheonella palauensis]